MKVLVSLSGILSLFLLPVVQFQFASAFLNGQSYSPIAFLPSPSSSPSTLPCPLYGIPEWRAKFSNIDGNPSPTNSSLTASPSSSLSTSSSTSATVPPTPSTLPLLLLPFTPSQILLPGQTTTLTFRHGKYMDIIDESISSYESVVGLSVLDEDGLLPVVVLCEVLEEELIMNPGFRGVVSMEVGLRAVGRASRLDCVGGGGDDDVDVAATGGDDEDGNNVDASGSITFGRTALDDIHLGNFVDWYDDDMDDNSLKLAGEYVRNIESSLMLPSSSSSPSYPLNTSDVHKSSLAQNEERGDADKTQRQSALYLNTYRNVIGSLTSRSIGSDGMDRDQQQGLKQQQAEFVAASWAVFAAVENETNNYPSIITRALTTTDTVERLKLGMVLVLESTAGEGTPSDDHCKAAVMEGEDAFQ